MSRVLVDTNVLLDVLTSDPKWGDWSAAALAGVGSGKQLVINAVIYAEVSAEFDTLEDVDVALPSGIFAREHLPYDAAFLAGKAHKAYRQRGGTRTATLPDFLIGAHAAVSGHSLLTRDARRYRTYFPTVSLIAPDAKEPRQ